MDVLVESGPTLFGWHITWVELIGQIFAVVVVLLADRRTIWTWPVQILATILLFVVYTSAELGGIAARQIAILLISVYGWWAWRRHRRAVFGLVVRYSTGRERLWMAVFQVLGTAAFAGVLQFLNSQGFNASWNPLPDAWIFVGTLLAFWAQARGMVEFWLIWLLVDLVGVPLQISSGLYFSAFIYIVFAALVVKGFVDWRRTAREALDLPDANAARAA